MKNTTTFLKNTATNEDMRLDWMFNDVIKMELFHVELVPKIKKNNSIK